MNEFRLIFSLNSFIDFRNFISPHFPSLQTNGPLESALIIWMPDLNIKNGHIVKNLKESLSIEIVNNYRCIKHKKKDIH
jgi:hypothetical protein